MVKVVYCFARAPHLTMAHFSEYWEKVHGPIGARIPGLRRLVQSVAVPVGPGLPPSDFDGVAELWFDDLEALAAARATPEWRASTADEANLIDPQRTAYMVTEERTIVG